MQALMQGKILKALIAIKNEIGVVEKDGYNKQQGFEFRSIDGIYNRAHSLFVKHGVITLPRVIEMRRSRSQTAKGGTLFNTRVLVEYQLVHTEDGTGLAVTVAGEGMDSGDKATSKAMSMAHKYMFIQVLQLQTEEDDPDSQAPQRPRDSDDRAYDERRRESSDRDRRDEPPPIHGAKDDKSIPRTRAGLGERIMRLVKDDKDKAKQTLMWLVGRDSLPQLTDFETDLGHMAVDVIAKCSGDPKAAKRWVNETWALPWFDKMTEGEFKQAQKHMAAGGFDPGTKVAEDDIPF